MQYSDYISRTEQEKQRTKKRQEQGTRILIPCSLALIYNFHQHVKLIYVCDIISDQSGLWSLDRPSPPLVLLSVSGCRRQPTAWKQEPAGEFLVGKVSDTPNKALSRGWFPSIRYLVTWSFSSLIIPITSFNTAWLWSLIGCCNVTHHTTQHNQTITHHSSLKIHDTYT